ncbi:MAG: protoporphyrinogen oxidase [Planctomycetaceae bacterium]|nr:protoporphyrinogen oxidase [Planctomycetaceae bacterium]
MTSDPATASKHVCVIGAGITGLATAWRLASSDDRIRVTVLESGDHVGGIIQTIRRDGFLIELGPDSFITNKPGAIDLARQIGFTEELIPTDETWRRSLVLRKGRALPVPDGFMLMAPAKPMAIMTTPILSMKGKLRLLGEAMVPRRRESTDESLASFVRRRFGAETLDRLVQPLVGGIYTSDPEKLSLQATLPRFVEMEKSHGSVIRATLATQKKSKNAAEATSGSGARYGLFLTARNGLTSMMQAIAEACTKTGRVTFEFNRPVREVTPAAETTASHSTRWHVLIDGEPAPQTFDAVIPTLPTHLIARLLPDARFDALRTALQTIEYASSAIVVSGHRLRDFTHPMDAFGLVIPHKEGREILAVSFTSRKFHGRAPDGHILLRTFVGGAMQPHLMSKTDDEILRMVRQELKSILGMKGDPVFEQVARYNNAMPQYHVGHADRIRRIEQEVACFKGLELAGSSYTGVGIPDSIASGNSAADRTCIGLW